MGGAACWAAGGIKAHATVIDLQFGAAFAAFVAASAAASAAATTSPHPKVI